MLVVVCVFCVVFCGGREQLYLYQRYLLCKKSISDRPKLPIFAHSLTKSLSPNHQNVKTMS